MDSDTSLAASGRRRIAPQRPTKPFPWPPAQPSGNQPTTSVIIPTYNEAENITILLERLTSTLDAHDYELIVVDDDSPDQTWRVASDWSQADDRIRVIRRTNDRGLSSAVLLGMSVASGDVLAVMDADLQHDERVLPDLISAIVDDNFDICLGSREADGGDYGSFSPKRRAISWVGASLARALLGLPVTDPMSGFFAVSRTRFELVSDRINPRGFKVLLEFLARGPKPRVTEVGYRFGQRINGATKLTGSVVVSYLLALIELSTGRFMSATFTAYALVGALGVLVRAGSGWILDRLGFEWAILAAIEISILFNFVLNNTFTFSSLTHRRSAMVRPMLIFHLVSAQGVLVQTGVTALLSDQDASIAATFSSWNAIPALLIGVLAATVGNYFLNVTQTWKASASA